VHQSAPKREGEMCQSSINFKGVPKLIDDMYFMK
jgi:hypothetical protein